MNRTVLVLIFCCALAACNPSESGNETNASRADVDPNLECAALISGANFLITRGKVGSDPVLSENEALVDLMTYLNTYAIPKGLKEPEAFRELRAHRSTLLSSLPSSEVVNRAKRCMENRSP